MILPNYACMEFTFAWLVQKFETKNRQERYCNGSVISLWPWNCVVCGTEGLKSPHLIPVFQNPGFYTQKRKGDQDSIYTVPTYCPSHRDHPPPTSPTSAREGLRCLPLKSRMGSNGPQPFNGAAQLP